MSESFTIEPVDTTFDVATINRYVDTLPCGARDATTPEVVMLLDSNHMLEYATESRADDPTRFPPAVTLLQVEPHRVLVTPGSEGIATARQFVQWLAQRYRLRFLDGEMRDVTAQAQQGLDFLFIEQ
ncbi:MAG: hypothetical protein HOV81_21305 [Kofleriaceae bacterium]|nr:hypothetical protein [Kofleriaceae bacterium]